MNTKVKVALMSAAAFAVSAFAVAHSPAHKAASHPVGHRAELRGYYVQHITNPGFEAAVFSPWNNSTSYFEDGEGDFSYIDLGGYTTDAHSGAHGFDMEVGEGAYNQLYVCNLYQPISAFSSSSVVNASVWAIAGGQYLNVTIYYSDGTISYGSQFFDASSALPANHGWQQWNFLSLIKKGKTITGIEFNADSGEGDDITIDDASLQSFVSLPY